MDADRSSPVKAPPSKAPPGPRGLPVFGSLLGLGNQPHLAINRIAKQYGDICSLRFGSVPTVVISHPDLLKEAFDKTELADRWVGEVNDILSHHGKDLAFAPYGEHWRQLQRFANRELLSMRRLQQIREQHIEEVVNSLVQEVGERSDSGLLVEPREMLPRSNAMIMFRAIFGSDESDTGEFAKQRDELVNLVYWVFQHATATNLGDYIPWLKILPNNTAEEAKGKLVIRDRIIGSLIDGARARPGLDLANPTCLVEVMLAKENQGEISRETVLLLISDLLFAGIDTSAQTVSWLLLILANRPEVQSRVHEEMDRVIGLDRRPTLEDRDRLPYLNSVLLESMRYRTIGPLAVPHKAGQRCEVGGFTIPQGAQVLGNVYAIHHDPRFWDRPDEFLPDRFLPQPDGSPPAALAGNAFIPFGVGHRACPGRRFGELVVWLHVSRLLHRYQFQVAEPDTRPLSEEEVFGLAISPKPFSLRAVRRGI